MRLKLLYPEWGDFPLVYRRYIPVLGLARVAGLTPEGWDVSFTDERIERLTICDDTDLVGISLMTPQAKRAYEIADAYRAMGVPVILGGTHVSLAPQDALEHADAIVIGEAEGVWASALEDFQRSGLRRTYRCELPALSGPLPDWKVICEGKGYLPLNSIQVSRGCPVRCETCSVPLISGTTFSMRGIDDLVEEISMLDQYVFVVNDNLHLAKRRSLPFFEALRESGKKWVGLSSLKAAEDAHFLQALRDSGCWSMYVDLSPWISAGLNDIIDGVEVSRAGEFIRRFQDMGIKLIASFVFGFDHDDLGTFEKTVSFARSHGIDEAEFHVLTPYPGSRLYERLLTQGRLLTTDFEEYTTARVVFRPAQMTAAQLYDGYVSAWQHFYGDACEMTDRGPVVRTFACFPASREDIMSAGGVRWLDSVIKGDKGGTNDRKV